ncbi:MAG: FimV/HubP family polar landmark protein [Pseudomonadota bacterium]
MSTEVGVKTAARAAAVFCGALASSQALALGLGELNMSSFLNEPLKAEVELLDTRALTADDVRIRLAGVDDFERLGIDRDYFLTSIQFEVDIDEASGRGVIRLSTEDAVLEPFLDLIIEARWPNGRLLREYTILVDPPAFRQEVVTVSAKERVAEVEGREDASPKAEEPQEVTTGDRIRRRESSLAPGEMPARDFSAETVGEPTPGNRYMVRRDETLWQIASQGKPGGISVQQAMLDIQRLNPEAFINGNINRIKAGYIIYLPAAGEISSDDLAAALEEVREQNASFEAGAATPGVSAAASLRISAEPAGQRGDQSSSYESTGVEESATASIDELVQPGSDTSVSTDPAAEGASGSNELAAQMDSMTSRLDTLEQIVALKDEKIATLEQALREAREATAAAQADLQASRTAPAIAPAVNTESTSSVPSSDRGTSSNSSSGGIPWLPIGGGLLAVLLGVFFFLRRRANSESAIEGTSFASEADEDDVFQGVSLDKTALDEEDELPIETLLDQADLEDEAIDDDEEDGDEEEVEGEDELDLGGSRGYGERKHDDYIDDASAGDTLAEADIYIAYGRYLQAIELLETAINEDPRNSAYRLKLIELYVDMGEGDKAAEQLEDLRAHGDATAIDKAESLVGGDSAGSASEFDLEAEDEFDFEDDSFGELEVDKDPTADAESTLELAAEAVEDQVEDVELDLTEDGDSLDDSAEVPTLELDLVDEGSAESSSTLSNEPAIDNEARALEQAHDDEGEVVFDDLEIEDDSNPITDDELDFATSEDELDLTDALVPADSAASSDADGEEQAAAEDLLIADDADQMATKLDLARAYLDMGDSQGAKAILEEVVERGNEEQIEEAQELIDRLT